MTINTRPRIHAICLALNEEPFIFELLRSLYSFCEGISIITQYDRDFYGKLIKPDQTVAKVLNFPDPHGKVHLVCRRYRDETAGRNHEMLSICQHPEKGIISHGVPLIEIEKFHQRPDYFLIVDADEIYDIDTLGRTIDFLAQKRPNGMRVTGLQYRFTWNQRIPLNVIHHHHFGFIKAGTLFEMRRCVNFNESRLRKLLQIIKLPDFSARLYGFIDCPMEVGVFHHGSYLGGITRLVDKFSKHSHPELNTSENMDFVANLPFEHVDTHLLPSNIRDGQWPVDFFDQR
jgi:hypothetical protein